MTEASPGPRFRGWRPVRRALALASATGGFVRYAVQRFNDDHGWQATSALTYTTLLALVPLTTIAVGILSAFPAYSEIQHSVQEWIFKMLVPQVGLVVLDYLEGFSANAGRMTTFGIIGLVITAVVLLATIEDAFNNIWRVRESRPWIVRVMSFWALLTLTPLLFAASFSGTIRLFGTTAFGIGAHLWAPFLGVFPLILQFIGLTLLYQMIPNRPVRWLDCIAGGLVAALLFELSKGIFAFYMQQFPAYETIYGALAIIPIFLFWLYVAWSIVLFGAVVTAALPDWRAGRLLGARIEELLPARRLTIAVAVLKELSAASRLGVGLRRRTLADRVPVGAATLDGMMDQLRRGHFVDRSANDAWLLTRDVNTASLNDLLKALGIGLRGQVGDIAGLEGPWLDRLAILARESEQAQEEILGCSLASVIYPEPIDLVPPAEARRRDAIPPSGEPRLIERRRDG